MTYLQKLRDSQKYHQDPSTDLKWNQIPFIETPPQLEMEQEVNGYTESHVLASQSIDTFLSELPFEYLCRLCHQSIPHEFSKYHLMYSGTLFLDINFDLLSEHVYGCCLSCTKKISSREIERDGSEVKDPKGPIPTNEELESISLGSIVDSVIKDDE
jgi:hypothetical protein